MNIPLHAGYSNYRNTDLHHLSLVSLNIWELYNYHSKLCNDFLYRTSYFVGINRFEKKYKFT